MATMYDDRPASVRHAGVLNTLHSVLAEADQHDVTTSNLRAADEPFDGEPSPQLVRRRRASLSVQRDAYHAEYVLVENADGVLLWRSADDVAAVRSPSAVTRRARASRRHRITITPRPWNEELARVRMPRLEPNQYMERLAQVDERLNPDSKMGLRRVVQHADGTFAAGPAVRGPFRGKTLLIVHGTFSHATSIISGLGTASTGKQWLSAAINGDYDQVVCFEHHTLSVSPWVNALDLARTMAATSGQLDVIAHSRGGVVVSWWLEVLGHALAESGATVRVFLAGTPLAGTSLAAPDKIQPLVSLLTNIGGLLSKTLGVAAKAHPFATAGFAMLEFLGGRAKEKFAIPPIDNLGKRGSIDAAVALIPGLQGQSMVSNNAELSRLRDHAGVVRAEYNAVLTNYETDDPGLAFWKYFRKSTAADTAADRIFPEANDLVVDTASMTDLGPVRGAIADTRSYRFGDKSGVWHCNYFEQPMTINRIKKAFA
jgi:hypothetical protein